MPKFPRLIGVRVDPQTHAAFHAAARAKGSTVSRLLRDVIRSTVASSDAPASSARSA